MMCPAVPWISRGSSISAAGEEAGVKMGKGEDECLPLFSAAAQSADLEEDNSPKDDRPPPAAIGGSCGRIGAAFS